MLLVPCHETVVITSGVGINIFIRETGLREAEILAQLQLYDIDPIGLADGAPLYPQYAIPLIRDEPLPIPKAGTWLSVNRIAELLGKTRKWVSAHIDKLSILGEYRLTADNGRITMHFDPTVVSRLRRLIQRLPVAKRNTYTTRQLAQQIGKSPKWVNARSRELEIEAVWRIDPRQYRKRPNRYFEQWVLDLLKHIAESLRPPEEGMYTIPQMLPHLHGKTRPWLAVRLKRWNVVGERCLCSNNKVERCFRQSVLDRLINESKECAL